MRLVAFAGIPVSLENIRANATSNAHEIDEESYGFMIQCETCGCWQHGVCVGLVEEKYAPETYYCEECRPDMHPIVIPGLVLTARVYSISHSTIPVVQGVNQPDSHNREENLSRNLLSTTPPTTQILLDGAVAPQLIPLKGLVPRKGEALSIAETQLTMMLSLRLY